MKERLWSSALDLKDSIDSTLKDFIEWELSLLRWKENSTESSDKTLDTVVNVLLNEIKDKTWVLDHKEEVLSLYESLKNKNNKENLEKTSWIEDQLNRLDSKVLEGVVVKWKTKYVELLEQASGILRKESNNYVHWPLLNKAEELFRTPVKYLRNKDKAA